MPVPDPLPRGMVLRARQRLCSTISAVSSRVIVRPPAPRITTESPLPDGEVGAPYSVSIIAADGVEPFEWSTSGLVPAGLALNAATGVLSGTPEIKSHYEFTVRVRDNGSPPVGDDRKFKLQIKDGSTTSGASRVDIWNCHTEKRTIRIWTMDIMAGGWEERQPPLASQYDASGCPAAGAEPFSVHLEDGHKYYIAAVDPENIGCGGQNDPNIGACRRFGPLPIVGDDNGPVLAITID
jgi:hypothetical protein